MGEPVAMNPAVVEETLVVLLSHAKAASQPATPGGDTPRADVALSLLAMLAHLATANKSLRAQVKERVPDLRALGRATRAKRDALRSIHAELARYGLRKSATPLQRGERARDAATALNQELAGMTGWFSHGLRELETSAVPPSVRLVSELTIEYLFRTTMRHIGVQPCSADEYDRAQNAATGKLLGADSKERFHCNRGVNTVEIMREARDLGFITAASCTSICRMYDDASAAILAGAQDAASLPLMPQRAADTADAWEAFERYALNRLNCQRFQTARRLLLEDARMRVSYRALHDVMHGLRLDTAEQSAPAERGHLKQRTFAYVNDVSNIFCGGFPIKDTEHDVQSARTITDDDWSSEEDEKGDWEDEEESWGEDEEAEDEEEDEEED
jgi:hypothetical protein